jgi:class 3 adenylate cyclase
MLSGVATGGETRFARSGDAHIAYQVVGDGDLDILALSNALIPIESIEEEPGLARFDRRLGSFGRLIRFDRSGVGVSDPISAAEGPTLQQWVDDALAVLDAVGSARAAVFAPGDASNCGLLLAATHPERITSLVLVNGTARTSRADDYPAGIPQHILEGFVADQLSGGESTPASDEFLRVNAPSMAGNDAFRSWWIRAGHRAASPARARALQSVVLFADVRAVLATIQVPTLVLHRRADKVIRVEHGRYLGEHIPGARYVELEGSGHLHWVDDSDEVLDEIEEFLTGLRQGAGTDRRLATILFTDIVSSTERAAEVGDRRWTEVLDRHDAVMRRQLTRFGGREVNTTGDGMVAEFDGPTRAVTCGQALVDAAAQVGVSIRVGIHTGEVERRGDDVAGLAVHLSARVQALAQPGEVLVSRTVVDLVAGSGIAFTDRGEHALKGVPGAWRLYAVER